MKKIFKTKLFHVVKNDKFKIWQKLIIYLSTILVAFALGAIILSAMKVDTNQYFTRLLYRPLKNTAGRVNLINIVAPLLLVSIGTAFAFKMKYWNIGGEGQIVAGAIMATLFANVLGNRLPRFVTLIIILVMGAVTAGLLSLVIGFFKVKFGANETLLTLMSNYIMLFTLKALKKNALFNQPGTRPQFREIPKNSHLYSFEIVDRTSVFGGSVNLDIFIIISLIALVLMFVYFKFMKSGYEVSVVGDSVNTARYAGMNVTKIMLRTIFASGAIIGLAGALKVVGEANNHTLSESITGGMGWTAIIVVWLAKLNPFGILGMTLFLSLLTAGQTYVGIAFGNLESFGEVLQGIILFLMLMSDFIVSYKLVFNEKAQKFFHYFSIRRKEILKKIEIIKAKKRKLKNIKNAMYSSLKNTNKHIKKKTMIDIHALEINYIDGNRMKKQFMYKTINKQRQKYLIENSTNEKRMWGFR